MLAQMANAFKIPDLKKKIFFTIFMIAICRIGAHIPVPFLDTEELRRFWADRTGGGEGGLLNLIDMFSGRAFRNMTIFALGIMPYISASIILQLLTVVWPYLEKISKEGEAGRKKINQYTRYGTVLLAAFQSIGVSLLLIRNKLSLIADTHPFFFTFTTVMAVTAGTCFLMWLGERITEKGIGNGISLIIAIGIVAGYPYSIGVAAQWIRDGGRPIVVPIITVLFVGISVLIIYMQLGSRKIPIQHAKRVVGRKMMGGTGTHLPLKVNTAGVIPIIFSGAIMMFPSLVFGSFTRSGEGFLWWLGEVFSMTSPYNPYYLLGLQSGGVLYLMRALNMYLLVYSLLTIFFCYFYTAVTFNPVDIADNLKKSGGFIPGRRPGKATSDYIDFVLTRITLVGAVFLVSVAVLPQIISISYEIPFAFTALIGGTGLIIVVGVLLDTWKQIESQLMMRHYEGFRWRRGRMG